MLKDFDPIPFLQEKIYLKEEIQIHNDFIENKAVLGIDIYKYSEYPQGVQEYVPVLFNTLYKQTVMVCLQAEAFLFQKYTNSFEGFKAHFISTGDGGFQIFDDPIQAIVFVAHFQMNLRLFNSDNVSTNLYKNLHTIIGRIELRYVISMEKLYRYDENYYGPAIINNARILAKDHLNRLIIDFPTIDWFEKNINTIENLLIIKKENLMEIDYFKGYDPTKQSLLFEDVVNIQQIRSIDILKIGFIRSKNTVLEIFNLKIQIKLSKTKSEGYGAFVVTLGNLNTHGIE